MMKKSIITCSIVVLAVSFISFFGKVGLKTATIEGYGNIRIPEEWTATVVNGFLHISRVENGESMDVLVQYDGEDGVNPQFANIAGFEWIQDTNYSNSAGCGKEKVRYSDGSTDELIILRLTGYENEESTLLICVDKSISERQIRKITKSYECTSSELPK